MSNRIRDAYEARADEAEFILYHMNESEPKIKLLQETFKVKQVIGKGVDDEYSKCSPRRYPKSGVYLDVEFAEPFDGDPDPAVGRMLSSFLKVPVVCTTSEHDGYGGDWSFFRVIMPSPFESLLPKSGEERCRSVSSAKPVVSPAPVPVGKRNADGVMEYRIGSTTYVDISKVPFFRSLKYSWSSGAKGQSIITDYMRVSGQWTKILASHGMYEKDGQVYRRTNGAPSYVPPVRPARKRDDEPDDVELAAVAMMMEEVM